jgi:hypothetical protein
VEFYDNLPAPGLALVFSSDGSYPFLRKALFKKGDGMGASAKLVEDPPGPKFLCAFCIFILLAKYKDVDPLNPDEEIVLQDEEEQLSWLNTLAVNKRVLRNFENSYFGGYHFFAARRGTSGKVPAFARFDPRQLKLDNIGLYRVGRDSSRIPLKHSEIPKFAAKLEEFGLKQKRLKWVATVRKQVEDIEIAGRVKTGGAPKRVSQGSRGEMDGCRISPTWRTLFQELLAEIKELEVGGEWYVVCGTPMWVLPWEPHFSDAVRRGAIVRLAHHAASSPDRCPSVAAQWKMNIEHQHEADPIGLLKGRLRDCVSQIAAWDEAVRKPGAKGKFEFYESYIGHPFVGILIVPQPIKNAGLEDHPAPKGTQCLLAMQTFYPKNLEQRVGLHFYRSSPALSFYYNSIRKFFLQGPSDGYLKRVDHLATLRGRKGKS